MQAPVSAGFAKHAVQSAYNNQPNIMTPSVVKYGGFEDDRGAFVCYEVSRGTGLDNEPIWGVSVVKRVNYKWVPDYDRAKMFYDGNEALTYAESLEVEYEEQEASS